MRENDVVIIYAFVRYPADVCNFIRNWVRISTTGIVHLGVNLDVD